MDTVHSFLDAAGIALFWLMFMSYFGQRKKIEVLRQVIMCKVLSRQCAPYFVDDEVFFYIQFMLKAARRDFSVLYSEGAVYLYDRRAKTKEELRAFHIARLFIYLRDYYEGKKPAGKWRVPAFDELSDCARQALRRGDLEAIPGVRDGL